MTKDHFLILIDWIETRRPIPVISRIYGTESDDIPAPVVSSEKSFPVTRIDFGWGSPVEEDSAGDWMVYLHLTKGQLKFIEQEASHVFNNPIDCDYLKI